VVAKHPTNHNIINIHMQSWQHVSLFTAYYLFPPHSFLEPVTMDTETSQYSCQKKMFTMGY